jgi:energy-coupling factor transport system ATP-binding protein
MSHAAELVFDNLRFSYVDDDVQPVLEALSLRVDMREVSLLTGASGAGKSTLLYLAAGLYPENAGFIREGRVLLGGVSPHEIAPQKRARLVGMMFQNPDLQFCMDTVKNEIVFVLENLGVPRAEMDGLIDEALDFSGIASIGERRLSTLSGGEKQKVGLACLAAARPGFLLLDEPFANIDDESAAEILMKLRAMHENTGAGILVCDHRPESWFALADRHIEVAPGGALVSDMKAPFAFGDENATAGLPGAVCFGGDIAVRPKCGETIFPAADGMPLEAHKRESLAGATDIHLRLEELSVEYSGCAVLNKCSANFFRGRVHALTGASGSGKSTLFGALCGLCDYSGKILLDGRDLRRIPRKSRIGKLGFVFQNPQDQFVADNVFDEILIGLRSHMQDAAARVEAEEILRRTDLWKYRYFSPYMLSQGRQRKLGVAALLAHKCELLVCDEPTYAQDPVALAEIMEAILGKVKNEGMTLLFSTHDLRLARKSADIVYELRGGKLYEKA